VSYDRQSQNCAFLAGPEAVATETPRCFNQHHVEVFVMMPLDLVSMDGQLQEDQLPAIWAALATSKADGFMVDVWWGITEPEPKKYNFAPYRRLIDEAKSRGFKVQIVSSFHQCGGNVGDACNIPLPEFVRSLPDIWYKDAEGKETKEYISLFADAVPLADQRTPLKMYGDWFKAFRKEFKKELKGEPIVEIMVGLGPCGEMRYPSYPLDRWSFPGIGAFQSFDVHALKSLRTAAQNETFMPPHVNYNDFPQDTSFFSLNHPSNYVSSTGHFFLDWYSAALKQHGTDVISIAQKIFKKVRLAAKISGIHWWYQSPSHAAEVTAGRNNGPRILQHQLPQRLFGDCSGAEECRCGGAIRNNRRTRTLVQKNWFDKAKQPPKQRDCTSQGRTPCNDMTNPRTTKCWCTRRIYLPSLTCA